MKNVIFLLFAVVFAICLVGASGAYPEYKGGEEDANVVAIQYLLRSRGFDKQLITGVYDEQTVENIKHFQKTDRKLRKKDADGICDAPVFKRLIRAVNYGATDNLAVQAAQYLLRHKFHFDVTADGDYGKKTRAMVGGFMWNNGKKKIASSINWRVWPLLFGKKASVCKGKNDPSLSTAAEHSCDSDWVVACRNEDAVWRALCPQGCHDGHCAIKIRKDEMITKEQFRCCFSRLSDRKVEKYYDPLVSAMKKGSIDTVLRQAAFMAQVHHESGGLKWWTELGNGCKRYEGRATLGNTKKGDGCRFKGRGPIQLTGRSNYKKAGRSLGYDLEANPKLVAKPKVGFATSVWFWNRRGLSSYADGQIFDMITYRVNGGFKGKYGRDHMYDVCKKCMDSEYYPAIVPNMLGERPEIPQPADAEEIVVSYNEQYTGGEDFIGNEDSDSTEYSD